MTTLIWIIEGPMSGQFLEVSEDEAEEATGDGWAERVEGRDALSMTMAKTPGPHKKAEAFFAKRQGYATRELRPESNPTPPVQGETQPAKRESKADEETATERPAPKETPTKPAAGKTAAKRK